MGMDYQKELVDRVSSIAEYRRQFKQVFRTEAIDLNNIAKAIAAYERTLLSGNPSIVSETLRTPFDSFQHRLPSQLPALSRGVRVRTVQKADLVRDCRLSSENYGVQSISSAFLLLPSWNRVSIKVIFAAPSQLIFSSVQRFNGPFKSTNGS